MDAQVVQGLAALGGVALAATFSVDRWRACLAVIVLADVAALAATPAAEAITASAVVAGVVGIIVQPLADERSSTFAATRALGAWIVAAGVPALIAVLTAV